MHLYEEGGLKSMHVIICHLIDVSVMRMGSKVQVTHSNDEYVKQGWKLILVVALKNH